VRNSSARLARPLFEALTAEGITVWYDEALLKIGDSLRGKIDDGLARCDYGIINYQPELPKQCGHRPGCTCKLLLSREDAGPDRPESLNNGNRQRRPNICHHVNLLGSQNGQHRPARRQVQQPKHPGGEANFTREPKERVKYHNIPCA